MFWFIDSCLKSVSADQYRLTVSRAQVSTHWVRVFFEVIRWQVATFQMIAGWSSFFSKCIWNKSCSWTALLKFCFQTDLGPKNSTSFYMQGRLSLLTFLTIVMRWPRSTWTFLCSDWSKRDRWVDAKIFAASENLFTHSWSWRVLCHLVMFLTFFFFWMYKMKYSCYQDSSVIHGWIVYCTFGWEMLRMSKSLEIRFRMASLSKLSLLTCPCLRCKRVQKSQAILASLFDRQEQHLDW